MGIFKKPPDISPYPSVMSLSTCIYALGEAVYKAKHTSAGDIRAYLFRRDRDTDALCVWSEDRRTFFSPPSGTLEIIDCFGRKIKENRQLGVTKRPIFIILKRRQDLPVGFVPADPDASVPAPAGGGTVLSTGKRTGVVGRLKIHNARPYASLSSWQIDKSSPVTVEVYNFSKKSVSGSVELTVSRGYSLKDAGWRFTLAPLKSCRHETTIQVKKGRIKDQGHLTARITDPTGAGLDYVTAGLIQAFPIPDFRLKTAIPNLSPKNWRLHAGNRSRATLTPGGNSIKIAGAFDKYDKKYVIPKHTFSPPRDFSKYDGIAFEYRVITSPPESVFQRVAVRITDGDNVLYAASLPPRSAWTPGWVAFSELSVKDRKIDPNGRLDTDRIKRIEMGATIGPAEPFSYEVEFRKIMLAEKED